MKLTTKLRLSTIIILCSFTFTTSYAQDRYIGEILLVGFTFCPRNSVEAAGQLLPIAQNSPLFSLYGTTYGGDGRTTFALPDLRGRAVIGQGRGPGLTNRQQGQVGGAENVSLSVSQLPPHTHAATTNVTATSTLNAVNGSGDSDSPNDNLLASERRTDTYSTGTADTTLDAASITTTASATTNVESAGSGQAHQNMMPYTTLRYCVVLTGIFPSRN